MTPPAAPGDLVDAAAPPGLADHAAFAPAPRATPPEGLPRAGQRQIAFLDRLASTAMAAPSAAGAAASIIGEVCRFLEFHAAFFLIVDPPAANVSGPPGQWYAVLPAERGPGACCPASCPPAPVTDLALRLLASDDPAMTCAGLAAEHPDEAAAATGPELGSAHAVPVLLHGRVVCVAVFLSRPAPDQCEDAGRLIGLAAGLLGRVFEQHPTGEVLLPASFMVEAPLAEDAAGVARPPLLLPPGLAALRFVVRRISAGGLAARRRAARRRP